MALFATFAVVIVLFLCFSRAVHAQESPFEVRTNIDLPLTVGALAITATPVLFQHSMRMDSSGTYDRNDVFLLDRSAIDFNSKRLNVFSSSIIAGMSVGAVMVTLPVFKKRSASTIYEDFVLMAEAVTLTSLTNQLVRNSYRRPRPYMYGDSSRRTGNREDLASFFSGHTATMMALAMSVYLLHSTRYPEEKSANLAIAITGFSAAAAVGVLRVLSSDHFWTDSVAGAVVGLSIGYLVPTLHKRPQEVKPGSVTLEGIGPRWLAVGVHF